MEGPETEVAGRLRTTKIVSRSGSVSRRLV